MRVTVLGSTVWLSSPFIRTSTSPVASMKPYEAATGTERTWPLLGRSVDRTSTCTLVGSGPNSPLTWPVTCTEKNRVEIFIDPGTRAQDVAAGDAMDPAATGVSTMTGTAISC